VSFLDTLKQGHVLSGNGLYELPSANEVINKIKNNARVRGAALEDPMPTTNNNIENFGGAKGVSG